MLSTNICILLLVSRSTARMSRTALASGSWRSCGPRYRAFRLNYTCLARINPYQSLDNTMFDMFDVTPLGIQALEQVKQDFYDFRLSRMRIQQAPLGKAHWMGNDRYPLVNKHRPWFYHQFLMETSLPTPMTARVELLIYQRVPFGTIPLTQGNDWKCRLR